MKLFKRIYYPVMGVLIVFMLVMSFVDATYARPGKTDSQFVAASLEHVKQIAEEPRNSYAPTGAENVRNYITDALDKVCLYADSTVDEDGFTQAELRRNTELVPTYTLQEAVLSTDAAAATDKLENIAPVDKTVRNIVVEIPGSVTKAGGKGDAVLVTAHYDSRPGNTGAAEAVPAAVMLQNIIDIINGDLTYKNDLVFVFTDAAEEGAYGALAFTRQFRGFDTVTDRVKLSANFAAMGTKGTLSLYDVSDNNAALMGEYAKINKGAFASSLFDVFGFNKSISDADAFSGNYIGIANIGGSENVASDTVANLSQNLLKQQAGMMTRFTEKFGDYDLNKLDANTASVFFTYLNMFTVVFPYFVSFILGGIILGLIAAVIAVNYKKKAFGLGRSFGGALVQLLTIAATVLALFISYYVIGLIVAGFGAFNIHAINTLMFGNIGFLIGVMILTAALSAAFCLVLKKTFNLKAPDIVRGNVWLWALIGVVMSFAAPGLGYIFTFGAILELTVMLLATIFKAKYKARFSQDIERLFLYVLPLILIIPMAVPAITIASASLKTLFLPLIMIVFMLMSGFITPYLGYLEPVLDRAFKKLPDRKIRVVREYEEMKTDPAKPGKKGEIIKVSKTVTEKVKWNYHNWMSVTLATLASVLIVIFSTVFVGGYTSATASRFNYFDSVYDDALVYVWTKDSSATTKTIEVHDLDAYNYIARAVDGLKWDADKKAYVKTDLTSDVIVSGAEPTITRNEDTNVYTFTPYDLGRSEVRLKITGASQVTKLTFAPTSNAENKYEVENNGESELEIRLPYGYGSFTMTVEGTKEKLSVEYREHRPGSDSNIKNLSEWQNLVMRYSSDEAVNPYLKAAIVLIYKY